MLSELVNSFQYTVDFIERQVADLSDEEILAQPPGAPNHGAWTLGHITFSCQEMASELGGERWLPDDWESRFGYGSLPAPWSPRELSKPALLAALRKASRRLCDAVGHLNEENLAKPLLDDGDVEPFPTMGHLLLHVVAAHTAYHAGQLAAWRRAIGRPPVEVYI